jgi:hypothetical protein
VGLICGVNAAMVLTKARAPEVSLLTHYGGSALLLGIMTFGLVCAGEGAVRLINRRK